MPERTAQEWADQISVIVTALRADGYEFDNDYDNCGSACCTCESGDITVSRTTLNPYIHNRAVVEW